MTASWMSSHLCSVNTRQLTSQGKFTLFAYYISLSGFSISLMICVCKLVIFINLVYLYASATSAIEMLHDIALYKFNIHIHIHIHCCQCWAIVYMSCGQRQALCCLVPCRLSVMLFLCYILLFLCCRFSLQ